MFGQPKFERRLEIEDEKRINLSADEKQALILERSEYLLQHIAAQDEERQRTKEEHQEEIRELIRMNGIDQLTGAFTRKRLDEEFQRALQKIRKDVEAASLKKKGALEERREHEEKVETVSLVMLDIDHFKQINDRFGHPGGDVALVQVAETLKGLVRPKDTVARWGGEEFLILLREADVRIAQEKAEQIRDAVEKLTFPTVPGLRVTASFGVISSEFSTMDTYLENGVDKALYVAKGRGRNQVVVFSPEVEKEYESTRSKS